MAVLLMDDRLVPPSRRRIDGHPAVGVLVESDSSRVAAARPCTERVSSTGRPFEQTQLDVHTLLSSALCVWQQFVRERRQFRDDVALIIQLRTLAASPLPLLATVWQAWRGSCPALVQNGALCTSDAHAWISAFDDVVARLQDAPEAPVSRPPSESGLKSGSRHSGQDVVDDVPDQSVSVRRQLGESEDACDSPCKPAAPAPSLTRCHSPWEQAAPHKSVTRCAAGDVVAASVMAAPSPGLVKRDASHAAVDWKVVASAPGTLHAVEAAVAKLVSASDGNPAQVVSRSFQGPDRDCQPSAPPSPCQAAGLASGTSDTGGTPSAGTGFGASSGGCPVSARACGIEVGFAGSPKAKERVSASASDDCASFAVALCRGTFGREASDAASSGTGLHQHHCRHCDVGKSLSASAGQLTSATCAQTLDLPALELPQDLEEIRAATEWAKALSPVSSASGGRDVDGRSSASAAEDSSTYESAISDVAADESCCSFAACELASATSSWRPAQARDSDEVESCSSASSSASSGESYVFPEVADGLFASSAGCCIARRSVQAVATAVMAASVLAKAGWRPDIDSVRADQIGGLQCMADELPWLSSEPTANGMDRQTLGVPSLLRAAAEARSDDMVASISVSAPNIVDAVALQKGAFAEDAGGEENAVDAVALRDSAFADDAGGEENAVDAVSLRDSASAEDAEAEKNAVDAMPSLESAFAEDAEVEDSAVDAVALQNREFGEDAEWADSVVDSSALRDSEFAEDAEGEEEMPTSQVQQLPSSRDESRAFAVTAATWMPPQEHEVVLANTFMTLDVDSVGISQPDTVRTDASVGGDASATRDSDRQGVEPEVKGDGRTQEPSLSQKAENDIEDRRRKPVLGRQSGSPRCSRKRGGEKSAKDGEVPKIASNAIVQHATLLGLESEDVELGLGRQDNQSPPHAAGSAAAAAKPSAARRVEQQHTGAHAHARPLESAASPQGSPEKRTTNPHRAQQRLSAILASAAASLGVVAVGGWLQARWLSLRSSLVNTPPAQPTPAQGATPSLAPRPAMARNEPTLPGAPPRRQASKHATASGRNVAPGRDVGTTPAAPPLRTDPVPRDVSVDDRRPVFRAPSFIPIFSPPPLESVPEVEDSQTAFTHYAAHPKSVVEAAANTQGLRAIVTPALGMTVVAESESTGCCCRRRRSGAT